MNQELPNLTGRLSCRVIGAGGVGGDSGVITVTNTSGRMTKDVISVTINAKADAPRLINVIPDITLEVPGGEHTVNLDRFFTDPDPGDQLSFFAQPDRPGVATATVQGATMTVRAR